MKTSTELSPKQVKLRRQVLKDALAVVNKPNIDVLRGNGYVCLEDAKAERYGYGDFTEPVEAFRAQERPFHTDLFKKSRQSTCEVCALGAMFLGHVDRHNKINVKDIFYSDKHFIAERLSGVFEPFELDFIEAVFEGLHDEWVRRDPAMWEIDDSLSSKERLETILNVILARGTVVIPTGAGHPRRMK